jgi:O-antigen ligase
MACAALMVHVPMFGNSRGGMMGVLVTGVVAAIIVRKRPFELGIIAISALVGLRLAGPDVWSRFATSFASAEVRDVSAQSRLDLWADCWDVMQKNPFTGVGPDHWPLIAADYGWPAGKECHSLWFNAGAELGFPGLAFLLLFYGSALWGGWTLLCRRDLQDTWYADCGRMVVAALAGFAVSASFVSLDALEPPYYIALLGAGTLKVLSLAESHAPSQLHEMPSGELALPA